MPLLADKDVAIWVCPHGDTNDVLEYPIGQAEPAAAGCGLHGERFYRRCPNEECPHPLYHPSDLDDNFHKPCRMKIPWASGRYEHAQLLG